jgi:hypothetical protein
LSPRGDQPKADLPIARRPAHFKNFGPEWDSQGHATTTTFKILPGGTLAETRSLELHTTAAIRAARLRRIGVHVPDGASGQLTEG